MKISLQRHPLGNDLGIKTLMTGFRTLDRNFTFFDVKAVKERVVERLVLGYKHHERELVVYPVHRIKWLEQHRVDFWGDTVRN